MLDPFRPENPEDVERLKRLQAEIHDGFKDWVRQRRASRLKGERRRCSTASSGPASAASNSGWPTVWASCAPPCRHVTATKVRLPVIGPRRRLLSRFGLATGLDEIGPATLAAIEERLHWQRFGL